MTSYVTDHVEQQRAHAIDFLLRNSTMKNGAPKKAVTTPIGVSAGDCSTRPGMSTRIEERRADDQAERQARDGSEAPASIRSSMRDDDADESDQAADADHCGGPHGGGDDDDDPDPGDIGAE